MEPLIEKFHNLGGATISEHKKNFNLYLKGLSKDDAVHKLLPRLAPKNMQEQLFRVRIMQHFELHENLLELLFEENQIINRKIANTRLLIEHVVKNISAKEFVDKICPKISFSTRNLLLYRLGLVLNESGEDYFQEVKAKYGLLAAKELLPSSNVETINNIIADNIVRLNTKQLIRIHKRNRKILHGYFKSTKTNFSECKSLIKLLFRTDIITLSELTEFGIPGCGERNIKKILMHEKEIVIKNAKNYSKHAKLIREHLSEVEFERFFKNLFPKMYDDEWRYEFSMLVDVMHLFPIGKRYEIFMRNFREAYKKDFKDPDEYFLIALPSEDRVKFDLEDFPEMYPLDKSIDLIKKKLNLTQDDTLRGELVKKLVMTCKVNKDLDALLDVLKYFCKRHKNDTATLRKAFLGRLSEMFNLYELDEEYWKLINEILFIFDVNKESYYRRELFTDLKLKKKIDKGLDISDELLSYMNRVENHNYWNVIEDQPNYSKICILKYPEIMDKTKKLKTDSNISIFLLTVVELNRTTSKHSINLHCYPEYLRAFFTASKNHYYYYQTILKCLLQFKPRSEEDVKLEEEILELYFKRTDRIDDFVCMKLLKDKPQLLEKYAKLVVNYVNCNEFYYEVSKMHFHPIHNVLKEILKGSQKDHLLFSYSEDYLNLDFDQSEQKNCETINEDHDDIEEGSNDDDDVILVGNSASAEQKALKFHKTFLKNIKNMKNQESVLPIIVKYASSKYFQHALSAFNKCMCHIPENKVSQHLEFFLNNSTSLKKLAIFFSFQILNLEDARAISLKVSESNKNLSINKCLFRSAFSCFCNSPCESSWSLLVKNINLIDSDDKESLEQLTKLKRIPQSFLSRYIETIWSCTKADSQLLLPHIKPETVAKFSFEFCCKIMCVTGIQTDACRIFIYNFITHCRNDLQTKINHIYDFVNVNDIDCYADIKTLFEELCKKSLKNGKADILIELLRNLRLPFENFHIEILLELGINYVQKDFENFAKFVINQQKKVIQKYGVEMISLHANSVQTFFDFLQENEIEKLYEFIDYVLENENSLHGKLLAIKLLPNEKNDERQKNIAQKLEKFNNGDILKIHLANHYINLK